MPGPFSTRRGAALYLLVWLMLGLLLAALVGTSSGAAWANSLLFAVPVALVYACATGFSAYYLCRAYPLAERSVAAIATVFSVTAACAGAIWTAIGLAWNAVCQSLQLPWAGVDIAPPLAALVYGLGVILYWLSALAHYLAIEFQRARLAERRGLEAALTAADAELRMLRMQIDPHFLFNSLNSISALTSQDPAGAREMTLRLADFFRRNLGLDAHEKVTLEAELQQALQFLSIEKVRFGERLVVLEEADASARGCLVPPLILQPLVENALKHGIGNLAAGGTVRIAARRAGSILRVLVENEADEDLPPARAHGSGGIGLANVRARLAAAYGHEASLHWSRRDSVFRVELALPAETAEAAEPGAQPGAERARCA